MWMLVAFIAVPLIEIALFIQVGGVIGLWPTLLIVVLTAVVGTGILRMQGALALANLRRSFSELEDPSEPLAHGAMILFAGALLLTPGFFTDALGFALLIPPVRQRILAFLRTRVKVQRFDMGDARRTDPLRDADPDIIEGEFREVGPSKRPTHGSSGWTRH
jgi:UPF0716 protein FxsA